MWPVGPEPPGVYWRRRIIVLVVLVLVLVLFWWLIWGRASGGGDAGPTPGPTPAPTSQSSSPTASPGPTSESPTPSPTSTEIGDCADADILVEASAEEAIYPLGSTPVLTLTVTNIGTTPCKRDVGPRANTLKITSGDYQVWSSDDCNPSDKNDITTLDRGDAFETQLTWDGYLSEPGCPTDEPMAEAGEYSVIGVNGNIESAPSGLRLE